jgi:putative DNA primase/helicase
MDHQSKKNENNVSSEFVLECLEQNEVGDGRLYAFLHKGKFIYNADTGEMLKWTGHSWKVDVMQECYAAVESVAERYMEEAGNIAEKCNDSNNEISKRLIKRAQNLRMIKGTNKCIESIKTIEGPLTVAGERFDCQPWLLACKNGVVDLRTGKLRDGRRDDYISKACPTEFRGIDELAEEWEKALDQIFDGDREIIDYLQRLFGYGVTGLTTEHIFPVFLGRGFNGKTMLIEVIRDVLGSLAAPVRSENILIKPTAKDLNAPNPALLALKGLRLAIAHEMDQDLAPTQVKLLTGGDLLSARYPWDKHQTRFKPSHLLILLTNNKPCPPDNDFAFWSRVHLVEFPISFVNKPKRNHDRLVIRGLGERLKSEASGILAWIVRGCLQWQKKGLNPPEKVLSARSKR